MSSRHLSLRMDAAAFARLDAESRRKRRTRSDLAKALIEEGLRMEAHPGIIFQDGPAGRRPTIVGGPDVWEVVRALERVGDRGGAVKRVASDLSLSEGQVLAAHRYYSAFKDEIDDWLRRLDEEAERAEAAWRREQDLLTN